LINTTLAAGASKSRTDQMLGMSVALKRWLHRPTDGRPTACHNNPAKKLSAAKRDTLLRAANQIG
jgi:hypothetical protein